MATGKVVRLRPSKPCPICGKPSVQAFHPFCSARCADVDLNRWLTGAYVIPSAPTESDVPDKAASEWSDDEEGNA